jgi:hypothetical protein
MTRPKLLLKRLDEIGKSLARRDDALALIGLGSIGVEVDRLDSFSDLDFFVIVKPNSKPNYLEDLSWLTEIAPVAYYFANTSAGYKLLYEDGVFCEFAVFEEDELMDAVFAPGRIVWKASGVDDAIRIPKHLPTRPAPQPTEKLIGEALTNLYIGLLRDQRGEKLSAMRFIQGYAVDRILELSEEIATPTETSRDLFTLDRRFEDRFPGLANRLPALLQGYEKNRESALAVLSFLDTHFEINPAMKRALLRLCHHEMSGDQPS